MNERFVGWLTLLRQKALRLSGFRRRPLGYGGQVAGLRKDSTCVANATPAKQVALQIAAGCFTLAVASLAAIACLAWWFAVSPALPLKERVAVKDASSSQKAAAVNIAGKFQKFDAVPSQLPGAWPNFRGPNFDNISPEKTALLEIWGKGGPPLLWSVSLGEGYAGPAVLNGRVYLLDYDEKEEGDALRCFSLDDGREIWRRWYKVRTKKSHGISRTVPAVTGTHVVTIGPQCHVMCVNAVTGDFLWGIDLEKEYKTKVPLWYTGQCPLIDGNQAIIAPAGDVLMMGVNCESGRIEWKTPNQRKWQMSHSSIMPMTFKGRKMYVYCAVGGMVGVSAEGADRGAVLWETTEWNHSVVAPSPAIMDDGLIFVTAGYGVGSMMFRLTEENGRFSIKSLYRLEKSVFACEQQTPIFYRGHLFSILPNDSGALRQQLACMKPDGKLSWTSGTEHRFGLGPFLVADDKIFALNDDGVLTLARASPEGYTRLAQEKVLNGRESWGPMAIAGGRLLVRDLKRMICLDVRAR